LLLVQIKVKLLKFSNLGLLQIWDIRKPLTPLRNIFAHRGLILSLNWHPKNQNLITTGGRDMQIQIWDLGQDNPFKKSIQTISSISHLQWFPNNNNNNSCHIASSSSKINI
jgi:WD40 repeat protein